MRHGEMLQHVADSLRGEVRRHWGEIGQLERHLRRRPGYLAKLCQAIHHATVHLLFKVLEALGVDLSVFFAQALDLQPRPELALDRLAQRLPLDTATSTRLKRRLERTAVLLWSRPLSEAAETCPASSATGWEHQLNRLRRCRWPRERRHLLRTSSRFQHPTFLLTYLHELERESGEDAREAAGMLVTLLLHVLPQLPASHQHRVVLCRALGLWALCQHRLGRSRNAVCTLRRALHLARRGNLCDSTAGLLEHGAEMLEHHGATAQAHALLEEAQILYLDLDRGPAIHRVQIARARLLERGNLN